MLCDYGHPLEAIGIYAGKQGLAIVASEPNSEQAVRYEVVVVEGAVAPRGGDEADDVVHLNTLN